MVARGAEFVAGGSLRRCAPVAVRVYRAVPRSIGVEAFVRLPARRVPYGLVDQVQRVDGADVVVVTVGRGGAAAA